MTTTQQLVEKIIRNEWARVLSALVARINDLQMAEDALQDAVLVALRQWPETGTPDHPRRWLYRVALNKSIDTFRREKNLRAKLSQLAVESDIDGSTESEVAEMDLDIPDERLRLIFTCCHTALSEQARIALTLREMCGFKTAEIARAFLTNEITMAQRLVRAKNKIKAAKIPFQIPSPEAWPERLPSVLSVVYLIFNEGYSAAVGEEPIRKDLCQEGLRLCQLLEDLIPNNAEVMGLLALMLIHQSRLSARSNEHTSYIPLDEQDRNLWDQDLIKRGDMLLKQALKKGDLGPFQLQAAISGVHARAQDFSETNWLEISLLYQKLYEFNPSPVIKLNEIVARSFLIGPEKALILLKELQEQAEALKHYQPFYAAQADLYRRANHIDKAKQAYEQALSFSVNAAERQFLNQRLRDLNNH